jgi:amidase
MVGGLPVGLMIVGRMNDEATIYRVAQALESAAAWSQC